MRSFGVVSGLTAALLLAGCTGDTPAGGPIVPASEAALEPSSPLFQAANAALQGGGTAAERVHRLGVALLPPSRAQLASLVVERVDDTTWRVAALQDRVPDDDSVSSTLLRATIRDDGDAFVLADLKRSWRCWPDRGHQDFSTEPCE